MQPPKLQSTASFLSGLGPYACNPQLKTDLQNLRKENRELERNSANFYSLSTEAKDNYLESRFDFGDHFRNWASKVRKECLHKPVRELATPNLPPVAPRTHR